MIEKISPIILFVRNFDESLKFYRDKIGLEVANFTSPHEEFATFLVGEVEFSVHGGYKGAAGGPIDIHFCTSDIENEVKRLKEKDVKFSREPEKMPWGAYQARFVDPDGNEMDLYQF